MRVRFKGVRGTGEVVTRRAGTATRVAGATLGVAIMAAAALGSGQTAEARETTRDAAMAKPAWVEAGQAVAGAQAFHAIDLRAVAGAQAFHAVAGAQAIQAIDLPAAQDTSGRAIFHGKGACFACHGQDGAGTLLGPTLADSVWLHYKGGGVDSLVALIKRGVPDPKEFPQAMPPMGGAQLTDAEVQAVARYVLSLQGSGT